jgi:GNAT superfamily N-acetyltransferase
VHHGKRVGAVGLATTLMGPTTVEVTTLYVMPPYRRQGIATGFLRRVYEAVCAQGVNGISISAHWAWQPAVRFCLGAGAWVYHWKDYLNFTKRQDLPEHRIEVKGDEARFGIVRDGSVEYLLHAVRLGDRLGWTETPAMQRLEEENANAEGGFEVYALAPGTFALGLALHGFPLIRSDEDWADRHEWADGGEPEGLAYKIEIFEACDREEGFDVRTPRIPGIAYRNYDAID